MKNGNRDPRKIADKTQKTTKKLLEKAKGKIVNVTDQNDDGELNMDDISIMADALSSAAKNTTKTIKEGIDTKNREKEKKALQPIFPEDLDDAKFLMSKLIRITRIDKKHAESEICQGSIGHISERKNLRVVNLYTDKVDCFGLTFYPNKNREIYYVDPCNHKKYIALDDYFDYLKSVRVNELQKVAQDLGAKHFRVTYKEQTSSFSMKKAKAQADGVEVAIDRTSMDEGNVEIAAESEFPGHAPVEPCLNYLQHEPSIQTLVAMRMDKSAPLSHQQYTLKLSNTSGIKETDAIKIDAALKVMKVGGNAKVMSEVRNEARRFFEYEIDF